MFIREFMWRHDDEFGVDGWLMNGMEGFNVSLPGEGLQMAHDALEHFRPDDLSIEAEMLAFGSILYLRAEGEYWSNKGLRDTNAGFHLSSDFMRFVWDTVSQGSMVREPGRTKRLVTHVEDVIVEMTFHALRQYRNEYDPSEEDVAEFKKAIGHAVGWMRRGYRKAARRWNIEPAYRRAEFFLNVESELKRASRQADWGDTIVLKVSPKNQEYVVNVVEDEEKFAY